MNEDVSKLVAASNNFSLTLLQELLSKEAGDNIILSGFGLFTILTLFCETSTGRTEKELVKTLQIGDLHKNNPFFLFKTLFDQLKMRPTKKKLLFRLNFLIG